MRRSRLLVSSLLALPLLASALPLPAGRAPVIPTPPNPAPAGATTRSPAPVIGAAARSFPETRDRLRVFTDQLPAQMTDAQMRFAATHYAGSQKMTRSWIRHMRALNPDYIMLHYQLALGAGPAPFVVGDRWVNDFDRVARHEVWFLHDTHGNRLYQPAWKWYVMDIRFKDGKPVSGFPEYWVDTAIQRMRDNEDDGCFADSYTQDILMGQLRPPYEWFTSADANRQFWLPQLNQFGAYCAAAFHQQPEKFYYLPNLGGLVTSWDRTTNLAVGDGGMNEGFCSPSPAEYYSEDDWKLAMTRLLGLASKGKSLLCQTGVDPANQDHRWFIVGSYLLTRGPRSYLNMIHQSSLEWYPEYTLDLGSYRADPQPDVMAYWNSDWRVFRRDYEKGMVLVNPSSAAVTIAHLGQSYRLVDAEGGGAVPEDGSQPGSLKTTRAESVTIPAHSARVFLAQPPVSGRE